jgi:hypothetical protein
MRTFGYTKPKYLFFMKHLIKSYILVLLLTVITGSWTFAQDSIRVDFFAQTENSDRLKEILLDNEYTSTGYEQGNFYSNPLTLNGKPLDFFEFNLGSKGELTVIKGAAATGKTIQVPFYAYLRRDGNRVFIPGYEKPDISQVKLDISEILRHAKRGDHLVIEPVNKVDGPAKRILKLLDGC